MNSVLNIVAGADAAVDVGAKSEGHVDAWSRVTPASGF